MRAFALVAAVLAAVSFPHAPLGIAVPIVAFLIAATVAVRLRATVDASLFGALALALAAMAAVLDAGWVVALDLAAACVLGLVAVAGPRLAALVAPLSALDDLPSLAPRAPRGAVSIARGVGIGVAVALPFTVLFWTADAAFAEAAGRVDVPEPASFMGRVFVFTMVLIGSLALALSVGRKVSVPSLGAPGLGYAEWAIPLAILDLLFLGFVIVQVTMLFGGHDHVLETTGLTYSEYARQGFWQLLAVALLTLVVIGAASRLVQPRTTGEALVRRALLGTLCVLTLVIVASAVHRLQLYEDAFGLTRLRLAAETLALATGGVFVLLLIAGALRPIRTQLPRTVLAGFGVGLLVFSLSNPDGRIADRNIDRWETSGSLDLEYLTKLSADAVPALTRLPQPLQSAALDPYARRLEEPEPWLSANLSRGRARSTLDESG